LGYGVSGSVLRDLLGREPVSDGNLPIAHPPQVERISRVVADLERAEGFYRDGLGFRRVGHGPTEPALAWPPGQSVRMHLGAQEIELVRFAIPGQPYPCGSRSNDLWFQHLAIVVSDMDAAYAVLSTQPAMRPISADGPQTLPPRNGGVRAFKFRDPDGHPLELIWFSQGQGRPLWHQPGASPIFLGIDHSALAVSDTGRSIRFYRRLGLRVSYRSRNFGPAQARLDGLPGARAGITGLRSPASSGPGIELLGYRPPGRRIAVAPHDIAADWITFRAPGSAAAPRMLRDPDGHRLLLVGSPAD
jgi:catechol 2,3-dioxygenase-like lactoylglutathione lyase family enzyme